MGKIQQLDEQTTNMIAAGEVVERPMGVVKELVENAIDAGSTHISISIEEGGLKKITISDNGSGMDASDAKACFMRHATSKIRHESDLWAIDTLGFRGEAIPSIASVARVTLVTSDGNDATRTIVAYGKVESASIYPCNEGTTITVEGLFYHTPARLKHMRSASYEASLIQDVVIRFALSHPEISFHLMHDNKDIFRTSGQGDLLEVVYNVYGQTPAENAIAVDFEDFDYHVSGYLIKPFITRASRNMMFIFLNGRMVRTYRLYKAVIDGYGDVIPSGRYPLCVLNIEMDPHLLDVNVHPSKWEVRISKEKQLEHLLQDEIYRTLHTDEIVPREKPQVIQPTYYQPISFDQEDLRPSVEKESKEIATEDTHGKDEVQTVDTTQEQQVNSVTVEDKENLENIETPSTDTFQQAVLQEMKEDEELLKSLMNVQESSEPYEEEIPSLPPFAVIGQYAKKYILASCPQGLAVIDQANVTKRITFEKMKSSITRPGISNDLLVPVTIHVKPNLVTLLDDINATFAKIHITFELFGSDTFMVRSLPSWVSELDETKFVQDLIDLYEEDDVRNLETQIAKVISKNRVQKTQSLTNEECKELLRQLGQCKECYTSIQGKPLWFIMEDRDLDKEFS